MKLFFLVVLFAMSLTVFGQNYYIVRHAEKAAGVTGTGMSTADDPPLTVQGEQRAQALMVLLRSKQIGHIFSTKTLRTRSTAKPLSDALHIKTEIYDKADKAFFNKLKKLKRNVLIVGHSDTINDIANGLGDSIMVSRKIGDSEFDNLFIVKRNGKKVEFEQTKYGKPSQ